MPLKAILFDFDGLILDTETPVVEAWRAIFTEHGREFPDWCWKEMIGQSTPESNSLPIKILAEQLSQDLDVDQILEDHRMRRVCIIEGKPVLPGIVTWLDDADQLGLRKAVVSSSGRAWVEGHLSRLDLISRFNAIVCGHEGFASKPSPQLYEEALRILDLSSREVLAIEDSPNGASAAKAAGIYTLAVPNELTKNLAINADQKVASLEDVFISDFRF